MKKERELETCAGIGDGRVCFGASEKEKEGSIERFVLVREQECSINWQK